MYNILYISYDGLTDPLGQSQILPYLLGLTEYGYKITILSLEKPNQLKSNESTIKILLKDTNIEWISCEYSTKKGLISKRKNNSLLTKRALELVKNNTINLIHSRSYPASIIAQKLSKKHEIPFIFDMRGFWADERMDGEIWKKNKPHHLLLYKYFKQKEKQLLKDSAHVISLTQAAKNYMVTNFSAQIQENKITVIPCCADLTHFNLEKVEENKKRIRKSLSIEQNQQVFIYLGSIGTWYLLSEMIDFFKTSLITQPNALFLIVTQNEHQLAIDLFNQKNILPKNYRILAAQRNEVPAYIHASNTAIYFIKPSFSKMASSPVKLAEFMGCGLPVIANAGIGDVDLQASQNNQLILVNELTTKGYTEALSKLSKINPDPIQNRQFAIENYSLEIGIERYKKVYSTILSK